MLSVGSSSILHLSLELENFFGKRDTLPTQQMIVPPNSCSKFCKTTKLSTKSCSQFPSCKDASRKMRDSPELKTPPLLNYMFPCLVVVSKEQPLTILAKTSQRCLMLCTRMNMKLSSSYTRLHGDFQLDPSEQ